MTWAPRRMHRHVYGPAGEIARTLELIECRGCQGHGAEIVYVRDGVPMFARAGDVGADWMTRQRAKRWGLRDGETLPCPHCGGTGWITMRQGAAEEDGRR